MGRIKVSHPKLSDDNSEFFHPDLLINFQEFERKCVSFHDRGLFLWLNPVETTFTWKRKSEKFCIFSIFFFFQFIKVLGKRHVYLMLSEWGKSNRNKTQFCEPEWGLTAIDGISQLFSKMQNAKNLCLKILKPAYIFKDTFWNTGYLYKEEHTIKFWIVQKRNKKQSIWIFINVIIRIWMLLAKDHCQIYMIKTGWMMVKITDKNQNKILWISDWFY